MKYDKMQADIVKGLVADKYNSPIKGYRLFYRVNDNSVDFTLDGYIMFRIPKTFWFLDADKFDRPMMNTSIINNGLNEKLETLTYSKSIKIDTVKNPVDCYTKEDGEEIYFNPDLFKAYLDKWDKEDIVFKGTSSKAPVYAFRKGYEDEVLFMVLPINMGAVKKVGA